MTHPLLEMAKNLRICSLEAHWEKIEKDQNTLEAYERVFKLETKEREKRRLQKCIQTSRVKDFDPLAKFDWAWPKSIDKRKIMDLFSFQFIKEGGNVVFIGPNGVGKTMISQNLIHEAAVVGIKSVFVEATELLSDLLSQASKTNLERAMTKYVKPTLLAIDEVGYLSYDTRHADLLFQIIHRRTKAKVSTIITTNRVFKEWGPLFPNAASVTALIDRLIERCDVLQIEADSYRTKRFKERQEARKTAVKK